MVTVERTAESIIFKVPATLDDETVKNIEKYIAELEAPADRVKDYDPELPFGEGFDKEGFVTDPVVLKLAKEADRSNWLKARERFRGVEEFAYMFEEE